MTFSALLDAVALYLNDATLPLDFTAVRSYVPLEDLARGEFDALQVLVVPQRDDISQVSRSNAQEEIPIGIGVLKHLGATTDPTAPGPNAEIDGLINLCQAIALLFQPGLILPDATTPAYWQKTAWAPIYDADLLSERIFLSVIVPVFKQVH